MELMFYVTFAGAQTHAMNLASFLVSKRGCKYEDTKIEIVNFVSKLFGSQILESSICFFEPLALELNIDLLAADPKKRPTCLEALEYPFFKKTPLTSA